MNASCVVTTKPEWRDSGLKPEGDEEQAGQSLILDSYLRGIVQIHKDPHLSISHTHKPTQDNDGSDKWV